MIIVIRWVRSLRKTGWRYANVTLLGNRCDPVQRQSGGWVLILCDWCSYEKRQDHTEGRWPGKDRGSGGRDWSGLGTSNACGYQTLDEERKDPLPEALEGARPSDTLISELWGNHVCLLKPPSLWLFAMAVLGARYSSHNRTITVFRSLSVYVSDLPLWGRNSEDHTSEKETKAQRSKIRCERPHTLKLELEPRSADSRVWWSASIVAQFCRWLIQNCFPKLVFPKGIRLWLFSSSGAVLPTR